MTSALEGRVWQHKTEVLKGFTKRYHIHLLVYYEVHPDAESAIRRERQIKEWKRAWKIALIEKHNPDWVDLYNDGEILPLPREQVYVIP